MKKHQWNSLVTSLRHGQCVLMLGSDLPLIDVRTQVPISSTTILRDRLLEDLEEWGEAPSERSVEAIAQAYEDAKDFGSNALQAAAERVLQSPDLEPSTTHRLIAKLPFSLLITTAQDYHLETALRDAGKNPLSHRYHLRGDGRDNEEFLIPGSPDTPVVYHLFGGCDAPASLVISENDVLDFLIKVISSNPKLPNSLKSALKRDNQTFLFLGFGIRRWDLRVLLKVLVRHLELNRSGTSFAAESLTNMVKTERDQTILFYERGTRVEVEDSDAAVFVSELMQRLDNEGGFTGKPSPIGTSIRVFISYERTDISLAERVCQRLKVENIDAWFDKERLQGGDLWEQRIHDEIHSRDFVLVLYSLNLCRKQVGYVNKELSMAIGRAEYYRDGRFLIPLRTDPIPSEEKISILRPYDEIELRPDAFEEDMRKIISQIKRESQRRMRATA